MSETSGSSELRAGVTLWTAREHSRLHVSHIATWHEDAHWSVCYSAPLYQPTVVPARTVFNDMRCKRNACARLWALVPPRPYGADVPDLNSPVPPRPQRPLRAVVGASLPEPVGALTSLARRGGTAWGWRLTLECGHIVERRGGYRIREHPDRRIRRDPADLKPPPAQVRCTYCPPDN